MTTSRYRVKSFSPSQDGVWDSKTGDFVKNSDSGRKKLFYLRENARKLADKLNKAESEAQHG